MMTQKPVGINGDPQWSEHQWSGHQWLMALTPGVFAAVFFAARTELATSSQSTQPGWIHLLVGVLVFSLWAPIMRCAWGLHFEGTKPRNSSLSYLCLQAMVGTLLSTLFLLLVAIIAVQMAPADWSGQLWGVFTHKWLTFFPFLILLYASAVHTFHGRSSHRESKAHNPETRPLSVWWKGQQLFLSPAQIYWAEAQGGYVILHTAGESYTIKTSLTALEGRLSPAGFVRTRRNALVNTRQIEAIERQGSSGYQLKLNGGKHAPLARRNKKAVLSALGTKATNHPH